MDGMKEEITRVARELYVKSERLEGRDLENWLEAERLVLTWHEPDVEREKHVGASVPDEHTIAPTGDEVVS